MKIQIMENMMEIIFHQEHKLKSAKRFVEEKK